MNTVRLQKIFNFTSAGSLVFLAGILFSETNALAALSAKIISSCDLVAVQLKEDIAGKINNDEAVFRQIDKEKLSHAVSNSNLCGGAFAAEKNIDTQLSAQVSGSIGSFRDRRIELEEVKRSIIANCPETRKELLEGIRWQNN